MSSGKVTGPQSVGFVLVAATLHLGCHNRLERFDNSDGSAYCGNIIGGRFIRNGFARQVRARLMVDVDALDETPAVLTSDDGDSGPCAPDATFSDATLRVSPFVQADALGTLEFGESSELNRLTWVDSTCEGTFLAVLSLMRNEEVELRLLNSRLGGAGDEEGRFGFFRLSRIEADQVGECLEP